MLKVVDKDFMLSMFSMCTYQKMYKLLYQNSHLICIKENVVNVKVIKQPLSTMHGKVHIVLVK